MASQWTETGRRRDVWAIWRAISRASAVVRKVMTLRDNQEQETVGSLPCQCSQWQNLWKHARLTLPAQCTGCLLACSPCTSQGRGWSSKTNVSTPHFAMSVALMPASSSNCTSKAERGHHRAGVSTHVKVPLLNATVAAMVTLTAQLHVRVPVE